MATRCGFPVPGSETATSSQIFRHKEALAGFKPRIDPSKSTVIEHYRENVMRYGDRPFLGTRWRTAKGELGPYTWKTWSEVDTLVKGLAAAIRALDLAGLTPSRPAHPTFGIMSPSREEWVMVELACQRQGVAIVPFGEKTKADDLRYMVEQTGIRTIACPVMCLKSLFRLKQGRADSFKNIVLWEGQVSTELAKQAESLGLKVYFFPLISTQFPPIPDASPRSQDLYCICYTSGTTGKPKGATLTNGMFLAHAVNLLGTVMQMSERDVVFSVLPLHHIYQRNIYLQAVIGGAAYAFSHGNIEELLDDMRILRPTFCALVPRILNKLYDSIRIQIDRFESAHKALTLQVINEKIHNFTLNHPSDSALLPLKSQFGGCLRAIVTAAAPIRLEVQQFLSVVLSVPVLECYGMTEMTGIATVARDIWSEEGVGSPTVNAEIRLKDIPEMGYSTKGNPPKGEICLRGPIKMLGYFLDPVRTREAIDSEGWLHSGDVGELTPTGCFKIIDRVKNFFKLSQGIYISPGELEAVYILSRYVMQVFVTGHSERDYLVAIVVPDLAFLQREFPNQSLPELCQSPHCRRLILSDIQSIAKDRGLSSMMVPKNIYLESQPFTLKNGLLNQMQKLLRYKAEMKYKDTIRRLYEEGPAALQGGARPRL